MKSLFRSFLFNFFALWFINQIVAGLFFDKGYETMAIAAVALGLFNLFVRPLINILLLPINILTLGTLRWLVSVISLYIITQVVPGFRIVGFYFDGFTYQGILIPPITLGFIAAFIAFSVLLSFISAFLYWLVK